MTDSTQQGYTIKDSGERQEFSTGSVRDTRAGKGRFDLVSPIALERLAKHYEAGAAKYGDRNWEKGQPVSRFMDSALRHLNRFRLGHRDEDHLIAALWNIAAIVHIEHQVEQGRLPAELIDWPTSYVAEDDLALLQRMARRVPIRRAQQEEGAA